MMSERLGEGSVGPDSSGADVLPPVVRHFMAAMVNNEAALRPIEAQGLVVLDKGTPLVVANEDQDLSLIHI
eukprot:13037874-Alexandrium_andersonii.AAC.1